MEVKRKVWFKSLATFLAVLMVMQILPMTVLANEKANIEALAPTLTETEPAKIECELEDERDEFSKTYLLEDGTYATYVSKTAIHTESDNGDWQEISEIGTPETMEELQTELSNSATTFSVRSVDESQSITTEYDEMTFQSIGNGLTGVNDDELRIQDYDGDNSQICSVGYVKINNLNLPDLGDACIVTKATLGAYCSTMPGSENNIVIAQTVEDEWPQANSQDHPLAQSIMDYNAIDLSGEEYYEWDITEAACKWSNKTIDNNGIALVPYDVDCKVSAYVDNIVMYYSIVNELDENFSFHSVDMGRAGTAYVNDFTNDFYLVRNELSIDGNIMPVNITRTYNNVHKNDSDIAGNGWHWNYDSSLSKVTISRVRFFKWVQEDGSVKYFESVNGVWKEQGITEDENGDFPGYIVTEGTDYNIISSEDDVYEYCYGKTNHKLEKIVDKNDKSIVFTYDDNYLLSDITDGVGRTFTFNLGTYGEDSFVNTMSVKDSSGNAIKLDNENLSLSYGYTNFNNTRRFSSVTYSDNKTVNYEYDDNGNMTVVTNIDGTSLVINYDENGKVTEYTKYASDEETVLDKIVFDSSEAYQRIFTDKNNKITRQQYDSQLNQISEISDADGYFKEYDDNNELQSISVTEDHTNLLNNPDFTNGLTGWDYPRNRGIEVVNDNNNGFKLSKYDSNVVKIPGKYNTQKYVKQTYYFNDEVNTDHTDEVYTAGVWAKVGGSISRIDELNDNRTRTVGVLLYGYTNDESGEATELLADITFDNSITDWQYMMVTFKLDQNYDGIQFALSYNYQIGDVYFDGATLYKSTLSSTGIEDPLPSTCPCENCTEPNCPCDCESEEVCNHTYCKRGTTTTENEFGQTLAETTTDTVTSMQSNYSYTSTNNYLASSTDVNGTTVYYTYDENTGKLTSIATGNEDDKINYTYNAVGLLKTVSQTITNIITGEDINMISSYSYDGDTLTSINHNGTTYSYEYDIYGNITNVKIGNQSLASYSYNNSEQLGYLIYGNGDRINYTYDSNGNITSVSTQKHSEETDELIEYVYSYTTDGTLLSYTDNINGTITTYTDNGYTISIPAEDDSSESTVIYSTVKSNNNDEATVNLFGYTFTEKKNTDAYDIETGQTTASSKYTLPCDTFGVTGIGESLTVTDYYGRNISSTFKLSTDDVITVDNVNINQYDYILSNSYTYVTSENGITTNLVESYTSCIKLHYNPNDEEKAEIESSLENGEITQEELEESLNYTVNSLTTSYEYDSAGRITRIYLNGELAALYKYDEAGQLIEEISEAGAIRYTYNNGGNITSKVYYDNFEYNEENNEFIFGEATKTISYTYNSSEWTDLLTSYNGVNIQYDSIGNPLNYQGTDYLGNTINATLEWDGRLLKTLTYPNDEDGNPGQKYEYSYNADGLRTEKRRYLWNDDTSKYELYQIGEYVWEDNILKGYRIAYPGLKDSTTGVYSMYIVLPIYDEDMEVIGVSYKIVTSDGSSSESEDATENVLYFTKDAQGNILSMYDPLEDYEMVYKYDAYGQMLSLTIPKEEEKIANMPTGTFLQQLAKGLASAGLIAVYSVFKEVNPFTYRGYMYDGESGLYYNQSRYYSPEWGRFINADDPLLTDTSTGTTNANNLFSYCENDPINKIDPWGTFSINRGTLATILDVFLDIFAPQVAGPMDIVGRSIKAIFGGTKTYSKVAKVITKLKSGVVPQFKGLFSKYFTGIRKAIWKATGYTISNGLGNAITSTISRFVNILTNSRFSEQVDIIICMFSIGGWIALLIDMTDGSFNSKCVLW